MGLFSLLSLPVSSSKRECLRIADIEKEKRKIGNILYHSLDLGNKDEILMALQLRLVQSDLYGGMDDGHTHYWWRLWRLYVSMDGLVNEKTRKGCHRALQKGNNSNFTSHRELQIPDDNAWNQFDLPERSAQSSSSRHSSFSFISSSSDADDNEEVRETHVTLRAKWMKMWLSITPEVMSFDEIDAILYPFTIKDEMLHKSSAYDDCMYPSPKKTCFGARCSVVQEAPPRIILER